MPRAIQSAVFALFALSLCGTSLAADPAVTALHIDHDWFLTSLEADIVGPRCDLGQLSSGFSRTDQRNNWSVPAGISHGLQMNQGRSVYAQIVGDTWLGGGTSKYQAAAAKGCDFILDRTKDPTYAGYYWGFNSDGSTPAPPGGGRYTYQHKEAIGHAIISLAMAKTYAADPANPGYQRYYDGAKDAWETINQRLRDGYPQHNLIAGMDRSFTTAGSAAFNTDYPCVNNLMHTFETLMGLYQVAKPADRAYFTDNLRSMGDHIVTVMYRDRAGYAGQGYVPEYYDTDAGGNRVAVAGEAGRSVNLGHNMEMSFLLSRAVEMMSADLSPTEQGRWLGAADKTMAYVLQTGYDSNRKALNEWSDFDGHVTSTGLPSWATIELLRATAHWAVVRDRSDLWPLFDDVLASAKTHFMDPVNGGWVDYDAFTQAKGSTWGGGYHEAMFYDEALRLETVPEPGSLALLALGTLTMLRRRRR